MDFRRLLEVAGEQGDKFFVEGEEECDAFAVGVEGFGAVAFFDGAIEFRREGGFIASEEGWLERGMKNASNNFSSTHSAASVICSL